MSNLGQTCDIESCLVSQTHEHHPIFTVGRAKHSQDKGWIVLLDTPNGPSPMWHLPHSPILSSFVQFGNGMQHSPVTSIKMDEGGLWGCGAVGCRVCETLLFFVPVASVTAVMRSGI